MKNRIMLFAILIVLTITTVFAGETDNSDLIRSVQQALNEKGYNCGNVDGISGKNTKAQISNYKKDNGLGTDDSIDDALLQSLGLAEETDSEEERLHAEEQLQHEQKLEELYSALLEKYGSNKKAKKKMTEEEAEAILTEMYSLDNLGFDSYYEDRKAGKATTRRDVWLYDDERAVKVFFYLSTTRYAMDKKTSTYVTSIEAEEMSYVPKTKTELDDIRKGHLHYLCECLKRKLAWPEYNTAKETLKLLMP